MKRMIPFLLAALLLPGCKQYTAVDLSFLTAGEDRTKMDTLIKEIANATGTTELEGNLVLVKATTCQKKKIRTLVDDVRVQRGLIRARWGP